MFLFWMLNTCTMFSSVYAICTFETEMPTQRLVCTSTHTHTHLICMYLIVYSFVVCNVKSAHVLVLMFVAVDILCICMCGLCIINSIWSNWQHFKWFYSSRERLYSCIQKSNNNMLWFNEIDSKGIESVTFNIITNLLNSIE